MVYQKQNVKALSLCAKFANIRNFFFTNISHNVLQCGRHLFYSFFLFSWPDDFAVIILVAFDRLDIFYTDNTLKIAFIRT